jgi:hypothetical protein
MAKPVDQNFEGMVEVYQNTPKENRDTKLGNPNGDVVDNSAGDKLIENVNETYQMGQKGANFGFNNRTTGPLYTDGN